MTKRLIINADDYGHTPGICSGIRQAHLQGVVTSTSAMMNRPLAPAELTIAARTCPNLGIGVHLVLTTGKSVLPASNIPSLVDGDGTFHNLETFVAMIDQINLDQVWAEWNAQVERFIRHYGKNPDHLDSHHHSSYFTPALLALMCRLADQLNCAIRKPFEPDGSGLAVYLPASIIDVAMRNMSSYFDHPLPSTTGRFIGNFFDEGATKDHLLAILEEVAADPAHETFEIMCHPAAPDHALREISDYNDKRVEELAILQDSDIRKKLEDLQIQLIRFSDL